jgi:hypothetical protein
MTNYIISFVVIVFIGGCSTGINGESVMGLRGSPMWFKTASTQTQVAHFKEICLAYGNATDTPAMAQCLQTEIVNAKSRAVARSQSSMTCTTFGKTTTCN